MEKKLIYESPGSRISILERSQYGAKVLVKEQKQVGKSIQKLIHQYELLKELHIPGVPRAIACDHTALEPHLVLEYAEGDSLRTHLARGPLPLTDFFDIALALCDTIAALHRSGILHKDINPNNIIWDAAKRRTTLIDYDCATSVKQKSRAASDIGRLEGTLAYMAPEQTGRINRDVDFRSDLYSLGVTFYEMLCGVLPFVSDDPNALVYAHIARTPPSLQSRDTALPPALCKLVMKLLEKDAARRYQSAAGLRHDLALIRARLEEGHALPAVQPVPDDIPLGARDFSDTLQFSQKLYGRLQAVESLQEQFRQARGGDARLVLVEGGSGTGKSALVNELNKSFIECNCIFISGKFDQYRRDTPYLAWVQAFEQLIAQILGGSDAELNRWKKVFAEALGDNGQVLAELIPSLQLVTGELPAVEKLGGAETQNRFNFLLETFLTTICRPESPLVIFLDDLQWADLASRQIIQMIAGNRTIKHLLLIAALRPAEEDPTGSLKQTLKELDDTAQPLHLKLGGLHREEIAEWLADTLQPCPRPTIETLSTAIFNKTWGNAFFTKRFIQALYDQELLYFDHTREQWAIREAEIGRMQMTDNVVKFMTQKITALEPASVQALKTAAVIGNEFDTSLLYHLLGEQVELERALQAPLHEGFIEILEDEGEHVRYAFAHDRIYQAVSEMNDPAETEKIHHQIALHLLHEVPAAHWYEHAFLLASHLNPAQTFLQTPAEIDALIQINLSAGRRAKASNAYAQAIQFLETGLSYCTAEAPEAVKTPAASVLRRRTRRGRKTATAASLEFAFLCELIEAYYLDARFVQGETCAARLRALPLDDEQRLQALQLEIRFHKAKEDYAAAIHTGIEALRLVGEKLPEKPGKFDILGSFLATQFTLWKKTPDKLLTLAPANNPDKLAAMQILSELGLAAYLTNQDLLPVMTLKAVQLAARHGNSQYSPSDYNVYGFILGQMGNLKAMRAFAEMSLELVGRLDVSVSMRAKHLVTYNGLTRHWFEHPSHTLPSLLHAHQLGRESGDLDVVVTAYILYFDYSFLNGAPADELLEQAADAQRLCSRLGQRLGENYFEYFLEFLKALRDPERDFEFSFDAEEQQFLALSDATGLCKMAIYKAFHYLLKGQFAEGLAILEKIKKYPMSLGGLLNSAWLPFLQGALAGELLQVEPKHREASRVFRAARKQVDKYAAFNPDTFGHRKAYLDAIALLLSPKKFDAPRHLRQAAANASKQKFPLDQALIAWKAARVYKTVEKEERANSLALSSYHLFEHFQITLALRQIERSFPVSAFTKEVGLSLERSSVHSSGGGNLDLATVIKTLQTISAEVVFDKLVHNLLNIVAENAGAEKGFLFLNKNSEWLSAHDPGSEALQLLSLASIDQNRDRFAAQVASYCLRTGDSVTLDTAYQSDQFAADPYIAAARPRSLMCVPLKNQGNITGLLYLENNLVDGAFKGERSELLTLLSSQLAVSIENTYLYENLEQLIRERTRQLEDEKQQSERLLLNILPVEVANELKAKGSAEATQFDPVSVLFTDFVNFTQVSEQLPPKELVGKLDTCFRAFDAIIERNGLEKIKTVGDAYIAVCGLPVDDPAHAVKTVRAALEIREFVREFSRKEKIFEIRIGIHSGPVVAGIVGSKKFQYDIWGDTVNTAARMEQNSEPGKINISNVTYALVHDHFQCQHRGKISAKNKGDIDMYFVEGAA